MTIICAIDYLLYQVHKTELYTDNSTLLTTDNKNFIYNKMLQLFQLCTTAGVLVRTINLAGVQSGVKKYSHFITVGIYGLQLQFVYDVVSDLPAWQQ